MACWSSPPVWKSALADQRHKASMEFAEIDQDGLLDLAVAMPGVLDLFRAPCCAIVGVICSPRGSRAGRRRQADPIPDVPGRGDIGALSARPVICLAYSGTCAASIGQAGRRARAERVSEERAGGGRGAGGYRRRMRPARARRADVKRQLDPLRGLRRRGSIWACARRSAKVPRLGGRVPCHRRERHGHAGSIAGC